MKKSFIALALFSAFSVQAEVVQDLSGWQTDGSSGNWTYNAESNSWYQSENTATGTFLYDPSADALGKAVEGSIKVSGGDDDWIGFALGYDAGDVDSPDSDESGIVRIQRVLERTNRKTVNSNLSGSV